MKNFTISILFFSAFLTQIFAFNTKQTQTTMQNADIINNQNITVIIQNQTQKAPCKKSTQKTNKKQHMFDPRNLDEYQSTYDYNKMLQSQSLECEEYKHDTRTRSQKNQDRIDDLFYDVFRDFLK
ncbi:hypothetical protein [Campylobacter majalis]|uniref:hypothetical protein n=1 Tax=Campylobacter majalis TaxID=2790656 RepID=UPI003D690072